MYNENVDLFIKSIQAVQRNIEYLCKTTKLGPDAWKQFVVVIISDGFHQMNPRVKLALEIMGLFDGNLTLPTRSNFPVAAHLFQRTINILINQKLEVEYKSVPMQCIVVVKQQNARKINSHRWFFNAVCQKIQPEVCILLDVGTKPLKDAFYNLYREFELYLDIGGACGEIYVDISGLKLLNPLVACQNFEYKMSNILDKPFESVCGYISVLPGAFSAYRWSAIKGRPLQQYFLGEIPTDDIKSANLYLAEDRILCWEVVAKADEKYRLKYVKGAKAQTDCPDTLPELISQRRRWLNGSFFAALHSLYNLRLILKTNHSTTQVAILMAQALYNFINVFLVWFQVGNFYVTFYSLFSLENGGLDIFQPNGQAVLFFIELVYFIGMLSVLISSLGNRPKGSKWLYYSFSLFFAIVMALMLFLSSWAIKNTIKNTAIDAWYTSEFRDLVLGFSATYGAYFLSSILHLEPWHLVTSQIQYLLLFPSYVNIFMIYAFSNLHDISWGTKNSTTVEPNLNSLVHHSTVIDLNPKIERELQYQYGEDSKSMEWYKTYLTLKNTPEKANQGRSAKEKQEDYERSFRTKVLIFWIVCNLSLAFVATNHYFLDKMFPNYTLNPYLTLLLWILSGMSLLRLLGSILYLFVA